MFLCLQVYHKDIEVFHVSLHGYEMGLAYECKELSKEQDHALQHRGIKDKLKGESNVLR